MEELLNKYISELNNKIKLLDIKNKSFAQILLQNFKYFDKSSTGYCNYPTFLKVNQKLGIILNPQEFQQIFFYYDINNEEVIYYNDLINDIYNTNNNTNIEKEKNINIFNNSNKSVNKNSKKIIQNKKPFFEKIINKIINNELGPGISLLVLYQGFILGDKNFRKKLSLSEFVEIMNNNIINLSISDIQMLFHCYNLNNEEFFYYEEMFDDLINEYVNNQRKKIIEKKSEEIINKLNEKGKINLYSLQNYINIPEIYSNFFYEKLNIFDANEYYNELINKYLGIKRILNYPRDSILSIDDIEDILNYISFGIKNNEDFIKVIDYIFLSNEENIIKDMKNINVNNNKKRKVSNKIKINENEIWNYLRKCFTEKGVNIFFNIIKYFQINDKGDGNITKNNFINIMKEFNININNNLINIIFKESNELNFIYFITELLNKFITKDIIEIIENNYNILNISCLNISGKTINLNYIIEYSTCGKIYEQFHSLFYEKYFNKNNKKDIYDLINNKNTFIEKEEFILFYKFIYFFSNDIRIKDIIYNHWKKVLNKNINNKERNNKEPEVILKLKLKLKQRGIRGLMNLHKEFIISCKDLSNITLEEFNNIFINQRLSLNNEEIIKIFNLFKLSEKKEILNFSKFIRVFKKTLNKERLNVIQSAFQKLDINKNNAVNIYDIKKNFNAKNDIRIIKGGKNEEEILCEFLDCFDLNYYFLNNNENVKNKQNVNFEEFANFYEYVSFLFDSDEEFVKSICNSWNLFE